jgi:hypothetical protein
LYDLYFKKRLSTQANPVVVQGGYVAPNAGSALAPPPGIDHAEFDDDIVVYDDRVGEHDDQLEVSSDLKPPK